MSDGTWLFDNVPKVREMYKRYHMPKKELQLTGEQIEAIEQGAVAVIYTGQEIWFVSKAEEYELHD